jgi:hypothetical protein
MAKTLDDLIFVPKIAGQIFYGGGAPAHYDSFMFEDQTVREIYFKDPPLTADEFQFLLEYVIYYIHAPIWQGEELEAMRIRSFTITDRAQLEQFLFDLIDTGIDIF